MSFRMERFDLGGRGAYWDGWRVIYRPPGAVPFIPYKGQASLAIIPREPALNISTRKVGGLRFVKLGRLCISFCITKGYTPL